MNDLPARLALLAAQGKTTTYGALAADLGCRVADLTAALERLMEEDFAAGRPMRAAVVNARHSDLPARGFFLKAAALGLAMDDTAAYIAAERKALFSR